MRKFVLALVLMAGTFFSANAQVDGKAIGLRFGSVTEVSYQHPLSDANRVELDLGLNSWQIGLTGVYHWVKDLSSVTDGLNWYVGPGLQVGTTYGGVLTNGFTLGIVGQIGAEYTFNFPLQLSLDYRPGIYLVKPSWMNFGSYDGICLSARYKF